MVLPADRITATSWLKDHFDTCFRGQIKDSFHGHFGVHGSGERDSRRFCPSQTKTLGLGRGTRGKEDGQASKPTWEASCEPSPATYHRHGTDPSLKVLFSCQ